MRLGIIAFFSASMALLTHKASISVLRDGPLLLISESLPAATER
jgi:hypothetical protein